ncbi:MAG: HAD family hydrolase [Firmicutes bacterium]|nr:HAD family hydrolase [Bacillota bacterium]
MIFFDLDGTLLDHRYSEYLAVKEFYNNNKYRFDFNEENFYKLWCDISNKHFNRFLNNKLTFSQQRIERIKELFEHVGIKFSDTEAENKFKEYLNAYEKNWKIYDDVINCLKELHSNYKLGIITNGDLEQQSLKLERIGVKKYFDLLIAAGDIGISKPNTKIFEIACNKAGFNPKECYYIGDNLNVDILPCEKINMNGIWLNRTNKRGKKTEVKTIYNLENIKEIL